MTLITDNLTKGNRKNIESALIGGQLNAMVGVLKLTLNQRALLQYLAKMPALAFWLNSKLSGGFTATWKTVNSHNKSLFGGFANVGISAKYL
jgi:hypothetical protein